MAKANDTKIGAVKIHRYPDGAIEFQVPVTGGPITRATIEYGDGASEDMTLPVQTLSPTLVGEHVYSKKGSFKVTVVAFDELNKILARKTVAYAGR